MNQDMRLDRGDSSVALKWVLLAMALLIGLIGLAYPVYG